MAKKKQSDAGAAEVTANVEKVEEQGYIGSTPDKTPNENYTVAGVTSGKPTPETSSD